MSDDDKKQALEDLIKKVIEPMIKARMNLKSGLSLGLVAIDNSKIDQFLDSISDIDERESIGLLTLGLSLVFRGSAVHRMTKLEFCDLLVENVKNLIDNPPPGFDTRKGPARKVDDCDCPACQLRRKIVEARKNGEDLQFGEDGMIILASAEK